MKPPRLLLLAYTVTVHVLLLLALWRPDTVIAVKSQLRPAPRAEMGDHYARKIALHARQDATVPALSAVFIGDSHVEGLHADAVASPAVNYGIGGDTTAGILARLGIYTNSLPHASAVFICVGVNDMLHRDNQQIAANSWRILTNLPPGRPVVWAAVPPLCEWNYPHRAVINNARIADLNSRLAQLFAPVRNVAFVHAPPNLLDEEGNLSAQYDAGDGIHLNADGYRLWITALQAGYVRAMAGARD